MSLSKNERDLLTLVSAQECSAEQLMAEKIMNTPCIRLNGEFWFPAKAIFMAVIGFSYTGIPTTSNLANKVGREHVKHLAEFLPADQSKLTIAYYAWSEYRSQKVELKRLQPNNAAMISLNGIAVFCALDTRKAKASIVDRVLNTVRKSNEPLQCLYENRIRALLKLHGLSVKDEVTIDDTKYRADILIRSHKAIIEVYERKHGHNKKRDKALKSAGYSILYLREEDFEKLQSDELSIALFKAMADFLDLPLIPKEDSDSDNESENENESGDESNEEDNR